MHSVLLFLHSLIPPRFVYIDRHWDLFSLVLWLPCRPNQSGIIWRGAHIPLCWAAQNLDAIALFYIRFNVCPAIVFAVISIIKVPIPVKPIFSLQNAFSCAMLIALDWMTVDSSDSEDIQYLSSSSREVLCRQRWWQWRSFWQYKCSRTIMLKEWPGCIDDPFHVRKVSHSGLLLVLSARFLLGST